MTPNAIIPVDGMEIVEDTVLAPGAYVLPRGIRIGADGVTLSGDGVLIVSTANEGAGISAEGRSHVTIQGVTVSGFHHGVRLDGCADVRIENVTVRNTSEIKGIETFLSLWPPIEAAYGGAILLHDVQRGIVRECDLQHQMNGLQLYGCSACTVERVNASFNSGWGVYLSASSDNVIQDNRLDFCNRVYQGPGEATARVEADAAAIVLVVGSSRNQIVRNSCLCGGDGIFVCGYQHPGMLQSCSDNLFEENDCRLSPNNAIESTFSKGNVFRRNNCSRSNYGFWMGYSWENVIEDNTVEFNRYAGIAAEHAHDFTIRNNRIRLNGNGVQLWTRGGGVLPYYPGYEVTFNVTLEDNLIESNSIGVAGFTGDEIADRNCHEFHLRGNIIQDNRLGAYFKRVDKSTLAKNTFRKNLVAGIRLGERADVAQDGNTFEANAQDVIAP